MNTLLDQPGVQMRLAGDGCRLLELHSNLCVATLSLQGGQLLQFRREEGQPLLYLSPNARFQAASAIRGGVPICWPWFGPHPDSPELPQHGIARTHEWALESLERNGQDFRVVLNGPTYQGLSVSVIYTLGAQLGIDLITHNHADSPRLLTAALHSYLAVGNAESTQISGLSHTRYADKVTGGEARHQQDQLSLDGELDRIVYTSAALTLDDSVWQRRIRVESQGSASQVLWNPGADKARRLGDLPDDGWHDFICIETANAGDDARWLQPGGEHTLSTRIDSMPL